MKGFGFKKNLSYGVYSKNINALIASGQEKLASILDKSNSHAPIEITISKSGYVSALMKEHVRIAVHSCDDPVDESLNWIRKIDKAAEKTLFFLGAGLGYHVGAAFFKFPKKVIVYERYPEFLKLMLSLRDYSREILQGKLEMFTWINFPLVREKLSSGDVVFLEHPVLKNFYFEESIILKSIAKQRGKKCAVLLTRLLSRDVFENLLDMGFDVYPIDVLYIRPDEFDEFIRRYRPHFVISVNFVKGVAQSCCRYDIPYVVWEIDPSVEVVTSEKSEKEAIIFYTYRRNRVPILLRRGFKRVFYIPLATNHHRFRPVRISDSEKKRYESDISFVGSSMIDQSRRLKSLLLKSVPVSLAKRLEETLSVQKNNLDKHLLPTLITKILPNAGNPWVIKDINGVYIDGTMCLAEECASHRRIKVVNSLGELASDYVIKIWGDEGWKSFLDNRIKYCGKAGRFYELPLIYNSTKVNLDINRLYQTDMVTLRVFDILATRSFVLADYSREIELLFGGVVPTYKSAEELVKLARYYLKRPDERRDMASKGYEIVLQKHTIKHRLERILSDLKVLGWM